MTALALVCGVGCQRASTAFGAQSLVGAWRFQPGDDPAWAAPDFDDSAWPVLHVPRSWGRQGYDQVFGLAWYRTRVPWSWPADVPVGLALGKIDSAYEVYANGRRLGGIGQLPPAPVMEYDRHRIYVVPAGARAADGTVTIALRVWRADGKSPGAAGPVEGPFEIGPLTTVAERDLLSESAQLGLVVLFVAAGVFHLGLRVLRPGMTAYGWFGLLALESATYAFLRTQWKYVLFDDFVLLKKIEHLMIYVVPATFLQFLWVFFDRPVPHVVRVFQAVLVVAGAVIVSAPGLTTALAALPAVQYAALGSAAAGAVFVVPFARQGDPEARLLGFGAILLVVTIASDFTVDRNLVVAPRTTVYGFAVLVFGMSLALANRFHRVLADLDTLRRDLEQRVKARTHELSAAYSKMEALALRDGLTGLLNRRAMQDRVHAGVLRARRQQSSYALAMIDVDHFKTINDTHGHAVGDQVLEHVARQLVTSLRASDDVGRWGGEEFLAFLPDAEPAVAAAAADRLRAHVHEAVFRAGGTPIGVTVSVGVIAVPTTALEGARVDDLIREADEALYRAKARGRNRVECGTAPG